MLQYRRNMVVGGTSNLSPEDTQSLMDYILESKQGPGNDCNFLLVDDLADVLVSVRRWKPGWSKVEYASHRNNSTLRALKLMAAHGSVRHVESEIARANKIHDQRVTHMSVSEAALQGL